MFAVTIWYWPMPRDKKNGHINWFKGLLADQMPKRHHFDIVNPLAFRFTAVYWQNRCLIVRMLASAPRVKWAQGSHIEAIRTTNTHTLARLLALSLSLCLKHSNQHKIQMVYLFWKQHYMHNNHLKRTWFTVLSPWQANLCVCFARLKKSERKNGMRSKEMENIGWSR